MEPIVQPVSILLVEDNSDDALLLRMALGRIPTKQIEITHVETWTEAAELLSRKSFDALLLDLSLPDTTGRETFLKARAQAPDLPIVVLTGRLDDGLGLDSVKHGVQDYLVKGEADGPLVARAIRYAIERARADTRMRAAHEELDVTNFFGVVILPDLRS
jgi:DNA-binding response OmpR family regulator